MGMLPILWGEAAVREARVGSERTTPKPFGLGPWLLQGQSMARECKARHRSL
jgi:hypothetical protein